MSTFRHVETSERERLFGPFRPIVDACALCDVTAFVTYDFCRATLGVTISKPIEHGQYENSVLLVRKIRDTRNHKIW